MTSTDCDLGVVFVVNFKFWTLYSGRKGPVNQCLSVLPSFCPSIQKFSWDWLINCFGNSQHVARGPCGVVCDRDRFLERKNILDQKGGKWVKNRWKIGFLNLLENLVINFLWIWSIKIAYINCRILAQISYLGKTWFLRYGPKCFWPIRLKDF